MPPKMYAVLPSMEDEEDLEVPSQIQLATLDIRKKRFLNTRTIAYLAELLIVTAALIITSNVLLFKDCPN